LRPQCGIARCGDKLSTDLTKHMWKVSGLTQPGSFFRAGMSVAGERLSLPSASIEQIFRDLKPAHTLVFFEYAA
ncbi:MAG TPA: hypothetical protein PLL10_04450, partial [Elusimicrobiales bacterium]|nr:hypothetical protein [Elusimicrobiales bacterium]